MKIASIVGARPQFIKASPVSRAIEEHNSLNPKDRIREILVHTGQHYDENMSRIFFKELDIPEPDYNLGIGSATQGVQTARMLEAIERVLLEERPDAVVVYGDTNSTLAGALAAKKLSIKLVHIEAGLRSFNMNMPEEINRIVTDRISDILFCPTKTAVENLKKEGFENICRNGAPVKGKVGAFRHFPVMINIGDVMYDAAIFFSRLAEKKSGIIKTLGLKEKHYVLATVHRAENVDNGKRLKGIMEGLMKIAAFSPVVFPAHPRTRKAIKKAGLEVILKKHLILIAPLSYLDMVILEKRAKAIVTDSGGVQKEAFFYSVPCITVREETEWFETVEAGWNVLAGADGERIKKAFDGIGRMKRKKGRRFYGNGAAAKAIVEFLKKAI